MLKGYLILQTKNQKKALHERKNKKVIGLMKDVEIMTEFAALRQIK